MDPLFWKIMTFRFGIGLGICLFLWLDECVVCPVGYFCGAHALVQPSGPCAPGFLCFLRATVPNPSDNKTGALCPPGAYCQLGVRTGTGQSFQNILHNNDNTVQKSTFWRDFVMAEWLEHTLISLLCLPGDCSPGYYCDWGSSSPEERLCPAGFYCLAGTDKPIACGPGTFSSVMGNSDRENCEPCPAGYFCQGGFSIFYVILIL